MIKLGYSVVNKCALEKRLKVKLSKLVLGMKLLSSGVIETRLPKNGLQGAHLSNSMSPIDIHRGHKKF